MKKLKEQLYAYCQNWVDERINNAQKNLIHYQSSANEETKSSVGDKYETARAMAQHEIEKASVQLEEANKLKRLLGEIVVNRVSEKIGLGSLVKLNDEWYFLSISAGKVIIDNHSVFCVSPVSPIGQLMHNLQIKESFEFNRRRFTVMAIF